MTRLAFLLVALSTVSRAQPIERPAHLWIEVTAKGNARATLTLPAGAAPEEMRAMLARSMGCGQTRQEPSADTYRIQAVCEMERPDRLRLRLQARLGELTEALRQSGVDRLNIVVTPANFPQLRVDPAATSFALSEIPPTIRVDAWYPENSLRVLGGGVVGLLLLPCLLLALRPSNLLQLHAAVQALVLAGCVGWTWVLQHSRAFAVCALLWPKWSFAPLLALTAPLLLAVWIGSRLVGARYSKLAVTGIDAARFRRARFWMGATLACFFSGFASLFWTTAEGSAGPFGAMLTSLLPAAICLLRLGRIARGGSRALPQSEARARLLALAQRAGVPLRGVTLLGSREPRPPSARATRWGMVLLSESMLSGFSRREVDAIVCHELSHIGSGPRGSRSRGMMMAGWLAIVVAIVGAEFVKGIADMIPAAMLGAYFLFKLWRRREERKADQDAVRWSGDPEALIRGIARMSYANHMPLEWGAPVSWFLSHPVTLTRFEWIARAGGVPAARIGELLEEARRPPTEVYAVEPEARKDAAVAPDLQRRLSTRLKWYTLLGPLAIGLPAAWIAGRLGSEAWALLAGAPLAMAVFYVLLEWIVSAVRATARQRAVAKYGEGVYVGLDLAAEARVYNGMFHYDFGLVRTTGDALEFAGDRVRFALDRRLVTRVWVAEGPRHFTPRKIVCVEYHPSQDAPLAVFSVQPLEAHVWPSTVRAARRLCQQIDTWRGGTGGDTAPALPPPLRCALPEDRGQPEEFVPLSKALKWAGTYFAIAFAVDAYAGMLGGVTRWDPLQSFVPATVCAALTLFVVSPKLRWPSGGAGAVRKMAAD